MAPSPSKPIFTPCRIIPLALSFIFLLLLIFQSEILSAIDKTYCGQCPSGTKSIVFEAKHDLESVTISGDNAWRDIIPWSKQVKGGQIWVRYNETFRLPYGISMFHGLHCLKMLRERLLHSDASSWQHSFKETDHVVHCLSYLAQQVLCAGDDTLEFPWTRKDALGNIQVVEVDGEGTTHMCKDISKIAEIIAKLSNMKEIIYQQWKIGDTLEGVFGEQQDSIRQMFAAPVGPWV